MIEKIITLFIYTFLLNRLFLLIVGILILIILKPLTLRITNNNLKAIEELRKSVLEMGKGTWNIPASSCV